MNLDEYYPQLVQNLPEFDGRFTARKLVAQNCDVLFATYPAGTIIDSHSHATENVEVITAGEILLGTVWLSGYRPATGIMCPPAKNILPSSWKTSGTNSGLVLRSPLTEPCQ